MAGNTTTSKKFGNMKSPVAEKAEAPKTASYGNRGPKNTGQIGESESYANPMNAVSAGLVGIAGLHNDIGESSGFITDGYLDKNGTPYGEDAKFNFLPPGMEITNQENAEIHAMPLRKLVEESYPGDGWMPKPRDIPE
jgi:hypothetical protein